MLHKKQVQEWMDRLPDDCGIGVDEGGLSLVVHVGGERTGAYLEVGGESVPGEERDFWKEEVASGETELGYREWLARRWSSAEEEPSGHWSDDSDFPVEDWKHEVEADDTRLGYAEWRLVKESGDGPGEGGSDNTCANCGGPMEQGRDADECESCFRFAASQVEPDESAAVPYGGDYVMRLSEVQARVIRDACDLFLRMRLGQVYKCLLDHAPLAPRGPLSDHADLDASVRASVANLFQFLPDGVNGYNSSLGIASDQVDPRAKVACDICDVIRSAMRPGDDSGASDGRSLKWGAEPLIEFEKIADYGAEKK